MEDVASILEDEEALRYEEEIRFARSLPVTACIPSTSARLLSLFAHRRRRPLRLPTSRNPYLLDCWTKYLDFRKIAKPRVRYQIYERALK